ncbi:MAG: type II toxin-antitoxin system VapB family antitoxin [Bacteroidia bacterium]
MTTNISIDSNLLEEAFKVGGLQTQEEIVNLALSEFIQRRKQLQLIEVFGTIDYDGYDYKSSRKDFK